MPRPPRLSSTSAAHSPDAVAVQGDVADDADCRRIAAEAQTRWGRIDVLVNSAGTTLFRSMVDLDALDAADFARLYQVNTVGPYQMARAVAGAMRAQGGAIINISPSIAALNGNGSSYAYAASKGALNTLTLALARNLAPDIRVNAVLGMIEGRWLKEGLGEEVYERVREGFAANAALGVVATPGQVAATIGWLAIEAKLMTGQLLTVDAGLLLGRPRVE